MCPNASAQDQPVLTPTSTFHFACGDTLPCFTQCCRDVNIYLTPYDVLRLRRSLKIGSGEFLAKYTRHFLARVTNIPVVQFDMSPDTLYCKLVTRDGCSVYENRPWACRMFPLDLASREGEYQMIVGSDRCKGLKEPNTMTVREWLDTQGVGPYEEMERLFHSVLPPSFKPGAPMDAGLGKLLFLAYDLDRFAEMLDNPRFRAFYELDDELLRQVKEDDEAMLRLAFRYIRSQMDELYQVI